MLPEGPADFGPRLLAIVSHAFFRASVLTLAFDTLHLPVREAP